MWRTNKLLLISLVIVTLEWQCVDKYVSPYTSPATGYLVVEGYISGNGPTQFTLSGTIPLPADSSVPVVTGAAVQVEGSDGTVFPLTEQHAGTYVIDTMPLSAANQYRLRIKTINGEQYLSSYVEYKPSPPIDSISWTYNASTGVNVYANTHDPADTTRYYYWNYTETWEYTAAEPSNWVYDKANNTVISRSPAEDVFYCWETVNSSNIIVGTSSKLAQDVISDQLLRNIPQGAQQLGVLYFIVVRQYALTAAGYDFLTLMQQNTEELGSIFDPQPSQLTGNIKCLTNPSEPVIGWVSAGTVQQDSIFIARSQLPQWDYSITCQQPDQTTPNEPDSVLYYFGGGAYIPTEYNAMTNRWTYNAGGCIDCTLQGGTNVKPSFWPY
jgi:Domain of unknown function (DUF4249)